MINCNFVNNLYITLHSGENRDKLSRLIYP